MSLLLIPFTVEVTVVATALLVLDVEIVPVIVAGAALVSDVDFIVPTLLVLDVSVSLKRQ